MKGTFRGYEILLPLRYNDGSGIPYELVADTILELRERFGAVSCETSTIRGTWNMKGKSIAMT
jgi:hypothetical protein